MVLFRRSAPPPPTTPERRTADNSAVLSQQAPRLAWPAKTVVKPGLDLIESRIRLTQLVDQQQEVMREIRSVGAQRDDGSGARFDRQLDRLHRKLKQLDPVIRAAREEFLRLRRPWSKAVEQALVGRERTALQCLLSAITTVSAQLDELGEIERLRLSTGSGPRMPWRRGASITEIGARLKRELGEVT
jgi:hypothetical protein